MKNLIQMRRDGFTLIEILMAVLVIGILATIAITQFSNFGSDAKNAATKASLQVMRNGIAAKNALERLRCGKITPTFPTLLALTGNDVTAATAGPCGVDVLFNPATGALFASKTSLNTTIGYITMADAAFVSGSIPVNPWSTTGATDTQQRTIAAWGGTAGIRDTTKNCGGAAWSVTGNTTAATGSLAVAEYGWCYDVSSGQIWANSAQNDGKAAGTGNEATF